MAEFVDLPWSGSTAGQSRSVAEGPSTEAPATARPWLGLLCSCERLKSLSRSEKWLKGAWIKRGKLLFL